MARNTASPRAEGHDRVLRKEPCPKCGSKDNLVRYADLHAHCFTPGCDHWEKAGVEGEGAEVERPTVKGSLLKPDEGSFTALKARAISADTIRRFGYFTAPFKGKRVQVTPVYDQTGRMVMQKLRLPDKTFPVLKDADTPDMKLTDAWLYGRWVWGDKNDKKVVIFTGEHDAHAAAEVTGFKFPCVSVVNGDQGAVANIKANFQWLDRFDEIILFFDNDTSGQSIVDEVASLFDGGRVKVAKLQEFKDANEAKIAGKPGAITEAIYAAFSWAPRGIVNAREGMEEFLKDGLLVPSWPYPWPDLQEATRGMRRGEFTLHLGGTGIAKTTLLYHYAQHLMRWDGSTPPGTDPETFIPEVHPVKIGWLGFEDTLKSIKVGLLSIHAGRRLHLEPLPEAELRRIYIELFGSGQLEVYDPENAEFGIKAVMGYIKYLVKALGCYIIVIDPLSFFVTMLEASNRTNAEEKLAGEIAMLCKQLGCHMHISHHLKKADGTPFEEGGEVSLQDGKGAGAWYHFASNVFAYERDQQGARPDLLRIRRLKVRAVGGTGPIERLIKYDPDTGQYEPTDDKWPSKDDDKNTSFGKAPGADTEY